MKAFLLIGSLVVLALEIGFLRMAEYLSVLALFMHHAPCTSTARPSGTADGIAAIDGGNYGVLWSWSTKVTEPLHSCKETNT